MMAREKFSNRHAGTMVDIVHNYRGADPKTYCVGYARLDGGRGRIGEVWLHAIDGHEKKVNDDHRDQCVILSRSLQFGETLEQVAKSVQREKGKSIGWMGHIIDTLIKEPVDV